MPYARDRKSWMRSLRFRLMVWNAVVVIVTACVTLVALREGVRITLVRELDQLLQEDLREIEIALNAHEDKATLYEQLDRKDSGHAQHKWFAELIHDDGSIEYESHARAARVMSGNTAVNCPRTRSANGDCCPRPFPAPTSRFASGRRRA